jgi:hypothetical protein
VSKDISWLDRREARQAFEMFELDMLEILSGEQPSPSTVESRVQVLEKQMACVRTLATRLKAVFS